MFDIFKKKKEQKFNDDSKLTKSAALLIHAAKIDENYTEKEKLIIKKTLIELGMKKDRLDKLYNEAEIIEKNSNQILDFTREIKNSNDEYKIKITETLWSIIYSDGSSDMYEDNFMRRLTGLLYLDKKIVGDIKQRIKNKK
ncbi:TerB family tellurite resistance protein [Pelagibacterales bacterium SAG-MED15]|nr:TerB family tellurite resistance protein [Pelagibacterales bacterium SAG-MED15]